MAQRVSIRPDIASVVALAGALERDGQQVTGATAARDRQIAPALAEGGGDRVAVALAWLEAVESQDENVRSVHHRAEMAIHVTSFLICAAAVLVGWGTTLAAFYFDGSERVNVVSVLALLVVLPALLLMPFFIAALPGWVVGKVPGANVLAALSRAISPGRLAPCLWRMFPGDLRNAVALISGRMTGHHRLYSGVQKWALLKWSQMFAVTFQITVLAACLVLVVFTDLAFGWSTTLTTGNAALDAQRVHRITSVIAAPWSWALDDAEPSRELIEQSRYYRVASGSVSRTEAARLGSWWRFVALTIVVYGLLPRVITLAVASARLRAAARAAIIAEPGLSAVLRRIHRAQIETQAVQPEPADGGRPQIDDAGRNVHLNSGEIATVINWSSVPVDSGIFGTLFPGAQVFEAGGAAAVHDDAALAKKLGGSPGGDVVIVVKAWEPPLMEFTDFVDTLRKAGSGGPRMIFVVPIGLDGGSELGAASPAQFKIWRDKLAAVGDPWLRVVATIQEVRS